jgi:hypothetical protein
LETEILATLLDFLFAMNSPVTGERYSTRLRSFFVYIGIEGATLEEQTLIDVLELRLQGIVRLPEKEGQGTNVNSKKY